TSNGTALAGSDYTAKTGTLNWGDGESGNKTFTISITNDSTTEGNETVNISLSNATGGASIGSPGSAVLTILGSYPVNVTLTAESQILAPGGVSLITAYIKDNEGKICTDITTGIINFTVTGPGSLWIDEDNEGNSRSITEPGRTTMLLKAGAEEGEVTVTATYGALITGSVKVTVTSKQQEDTPFNDVKILPSSGGESKRIVNLEPETEVKIYTLSGQYITTLNESDFGGREVVWNQENTDGNRV
ncbi:unnamed protein product, partial [marine sediment metagenome]